MTNRERWWLTGILTLVALCGGVGALLLQVRQAPAEEAPMIAHRPPPPQPDIAVRLPWNDVAAPVRPAMTPYVACIVPEFKVKELPRGPVTRFVLPSLLYSRGVPGMDRVTLTWTLKEIQESKTETLVVKRSPAQAIVIHRQYENGEFEPIAVLDPKATSFEDRDVRPNRSYGYLVQVRGKEGEVDYDRSTVTLVDRDGSGEATAQIPPWHRVALKGGDLGHAILSVEAYNPKTERWEPRTLAVKPGQAIGDTGWRLEGLHFDKSTLKADVTDDRLETRELSTR